MSMRVSFLMLLVMALAAAATAHARFDLVDHASKDAEGCQKIPFLLCDRVCDRCVCDRRVPELAECTCSQWKQPAPKPDPHAECQKNCKSHCACTPIWPPELAICVCGDPIDDSSSPTISNAAEEDVMQKKELVMVAKSVGGFIPYPECIEKCDECVICTLPYPIEKALCYCGKKTDGEARSALPMKPEYVA